jgi:hypothetical protein
VCADRAGLFVWAHRRSQHTLLKSEAYRAKIAYVRSVLTNIELYSEAIALLSEYARCASC